MARTIIGIPTGNSNFLISEIVRTPGLPSRITHLKKTWYDPLSNFVANGKYIIVTANISV